MILAILSAPLWPLALIIIGVYLIWRSNRRRSSAFGDVHNKVFGDLIIDGDISPDGLDTELGVGDVKIDLTRARFAEKENRVRAHTGIGDIKIILPANLPVRAKGSSGVGDVLIFNKAGSGFGNNVSFESQDFAGAVRKVIVEAGSGVGDVSITRA